MKYLVFVIKAVAVFDLCCLAVYFGGDIVSVLSGKWRKKKQPAELFEFYEDSGEAPLSVDSIRQLYSGDVEAFVEERLLPDAAKTMEALTEREQTAARLLLCALIGYLKEEARMDEQSFPMVMELLKYMEGEKEEGCQDPVDWLLEDANSRAHRHESYYNDYQRYQLMQVDKKRVILACRILINDLVGKLYRYDYRFGYDLMLTEDNSIEEKLRTSMREEWEDEDYAPCDC